MVKWHPVRYGQAPVVGEQTFDPGMSEINEWYLYANGWALRVRTDLSGGVLDALSTVWLMRRNPHWITGDPPGFAVRGKEIPECPWAGGRGFMDSGGPIFWFNEDGESPEVLSPEALRELSSAVSRLDPRPDE